MWSGFNSVLLPAVAVEMSTKPLEMRAFQLST
jgi:hypothetical protein